MIDRGRLLEIIEKAKLQPEPHDFSYVEGTQQYRCISVTARTPYRPGQASVITGAALKDATVKLIRACASADEAGELIERLQYDSNRGKVIFYWSFADWEVLEAAQ